ncbi:hypothetical protein LEP1GSC125_4226 [Leptospira mayottensis 200901122]|uniref:Uncharacterized protein n=1 Tax=Leptospira mayottensis 200901122 TaxID=1193010 RepID=A0AA87MP83_9LEPT|nr:hypothetical protein LEP1GSC125_4226 [Leptospira mayottensis 200901122]
MKADRKMIVKATTTIFLRIKPSFDFRLPESRFSNRLTPNNCKNEIHK